MRRERSQEDSVVADRGAPTKLGHPYRTVDDALLALRGDIVRLPLASATQAAEVLRKGLDDGTVQALVAPMDRVSLANVIAELDARVERLRRLASPISRFLTWVGASVASSGLLALLARLPHGLLLMTLAATVAMGAALEAERSRRWIEIANRVDAVIADLRRLCREKPIELPAEVQDAIRAIVREEVNSQAPGVRVDPEIRETQTQEAPAHPDTAGHKERKS